MPRFPMAEWQAQSIRLTVFPMPDALTRSHNWWEAVTGVKPDEETSNPKKGSAVVQGSVDPNKLVLRMEAERIDWVLSPSDGDGGELSSHRQIPSLGPANLMIEEFSTIVDKWFGFADLPAIGRIAFGAVLLHPVETRREGHVRLPAYVPVQINPASSDFLYQINLPPTPSNTQVEGLQLNRLSKWSVASWRPIAFSFHGEEVRTQRSSESYAVRVESDINTASDFDGPIPQARLLDLFRELRTIGLNIASDGVVEP